MATEFTHMPGRRSGPGKDSRVSNMTTESSPPRLVYVDDSRTSAYVVKRLLRPFGYQIQHFDSAEPALIALIKDPYDLLITDLKISAKGMDGDDLVRALRQSGQDQVSSVPVIVITGSTDPQVLTGVYDAGANQIMTKPVSGDELDAHIKRLLAASQKSTSNQSSDTNAESQQNTANVVSFESETQSRRNDSKPSASASSDAIPVLKSSDLKENSERSKTRRSSDSVATWQSNNTDSQFISSKSGDDLDEFFDDANVPMPVDKVIPAPRVTPRIKTSNLLPPTPSRTSKLQQPTVGEKTKMLKSSQPNTPAASSRSATKASNLSRRKALQATLKKAQRQAAIQKRERAMLAAAARKITQAQKKSASQSVVNKTADRPQAKLPQKKANLSKFDAVSASMQLEPKQSEKNAMYSSKVPGGRDVSPQIARSNSQIPIFDTNQDNQIADDQPLVMDGAFENSGNNSAVKNIMQEIEMYPLIESDRAVDDSSISRGMSVLSSAVELYGPKRLFKTALLLGALAFLYNAWNSAFDDGLPVEITVVQQGEIYQSITVPGKVVSKLRVNITPAIAGRLTNVRVDEGDKVRKGSVLASLDDREAKSKLKRTRSSLTAANQNLSLAKRSLKRLRRAFSKGAVARRLVEDAEAELRSAKSRKSITEEEVRTAKLSLENPRIVAPFSGTITARFVEVGQWVVPSETLFTLIDGAQREVEVHVDAADSGGIAVGQTVTLSSDAFPGRNWTEAVTRLAAATSNVGNANTVNVSVSLGTHAPKLRFGQQVDADIRTAWNPNALKVPYGAVINRKGASWLAVIEDGRARLVGVTTGIEDISHIEILEGVKIGQSVILANGADVRDGKRVFIAQNL
jgi:membrane fusion protein (multidrug efflux system)